MTGLLKRALTSDEALIWWISRLGVFLTAWLASWIFLGPAGVLYSDISETIPELRSWEVWRQWDAYWLASIAETGYGSLGYENNMAFFPGQPVLVRGIGILGLGSLESGIAISLFAGLVAALSLARLTELIGGDSRWSILSWIASPAAVFLFAPYTEALFAAFAFSAWLWARRGSWWLAGCLGGLASLVRPNGIFLAVALVVLGLLQAGPRLPRLVPMALPFAGFAAYMTYLHAYFGSWRVWLTAQELGWQRRFTNPIESFVATYEMAFHNGATASFAIQYRFEILAMVALLACLAALFVLRWWAEAVYVALTMASLGTSTLYYSIPRTTLVIFPLWMLLGLLFTRFRRLGWLYLAISTPVMVMGVVGFSLGRWVA